MRLKMAMRACWVMGSLLGTSVLAAERPAAHVGATRDQVVAQFGEPKSHIVAGDREVMFYASQRIVLRNQRVTEVEPIEESAPPPPRPAPVVSADAAPAARADANAPASPAAVSTPSTQAPTSRNAPARTRAAPEAAPGAAAGPAVAPPAATTQPSVAPQPEVVIKSVRPPSHTAGTLVTVPSAPAPLAPVAAPATEVPADSATAPAPAATSGDTSRRISPNETETASSAAAVAAAEPSSAAPATAAESPSAQRPAGEPPSVPAPAAAAKAEPHATAGNAAAPVAPVAPAKPSPKRSHAQTVVADETNSLVRVGIGAVVVLFAGLGALIWWRRRQSALLEATAVSTPPFPTSATPARSTGTRFTQEMLNKLEWKRFEELVAAYYNRTGVVATRTKAGPANPVHVWISWKGEQRPFACVLCVARPSGLVEAQTLQPLSDVLATEDIRRGYVVTSGKFAVSARDLGEEKHLTLLSGDLFLEKLNALPDNVRAELIRDAMAGDYGTPSCPRCETKMARSGMDGETWHCPQCGNLLPDALA
jgi:hypothetical protein